MSKVTQQSDLTNIKDADEFMRFASLLLSEITDTLNTRLEFSNMIAQEVTVTFNTAVTFTAVNHNLNKTGVKYIVVNQTSAASVYHQANAPDNNSQIYLACTAVPNTITFILY